MKNEFNNWKKEDSIKLLNDLVRLMDHFEKFGLENEYNQVGACINDLNDIGIKW